MGHDLITIYWIKALEYTLALSYLPLFVLFWKFSSPKQPATRSVVATSPGWADQLAAFFEVPGDVFFHPGHLWARPSGGNTAVVGMSDFAGRLVGPLGTLKLPEVGASLVQGEPALVVDATGAAIPMLSPIDGEVVAVNPRLSAASNLAKDAPYGDGWLFTVKSHRLSGNLKSLLSGTLARRWMETVCESLGAEMATRRLGEVCQDGGQLVDGIARHLSSEAWGDIARRFFLTAEERRHA